MTFSGVLLAGGESRRMGRDKATILFDGCPLWERQIDVLRALQLEKIFVSARAKPPWLPDGSELLLDEPPSRGPLSGLTRALGSMQTTHLVVLAIDMPFMTIDQMRLLCRLAMPHFGVVPVIDGRAEPLTALYPREAATDFAAALAGTDFSLQPLVSTLVHAEKIRLINVSEEARVFYRNVNEPTDLQGGAVPEPPKFL